MKFLFLFFKEIKVGTVDEILVLDVQDAPQRLRDLDAFLLRL